MLLERLRTPRDVMDANGWLYSINNARTAEAYQPNGNNYTLKWSKSLAAYGDSCASPMVADGKVFTVCTTISESPVLVVLAP